VLGFALVAWVIIGLWLGLRKARFRAPARDPARYGAPVRLWRTVPGVVRVRSAAGPQPLVPGLFSAYAWVLLLLFRLTPGVVE